MNQKIDQTLSYYLLKRKEIMDFVNSNNKLTSDEIIDKGGQLEILEFKITALEIAKVS